MKFQEVIIGLKEGRSFIHKDGGKTQTFVPVSEKYCVYTMSNIELGTGGTTKLPISALEILQDRWDQMGWDIEATGWNEIKE